MLRFLEKGHVYQDLVDINTKWIGVTTFLGKYKTPFDDNIAYKNSNDSASKWFGVPAETIKQIWKAEGERSTKLGSWYHRKQEESEVTGIQCCPVIDDWKYAGDQNLVEGIHPEYLLYNEEYLICGQADRLQVSNGLLNCRDYKSNKKIDRVSWNGKKMMLPPIQHLQDCHLTHYSLQLSLYTWIGLQHNPHLQAGKLEVYHVKFVEIGQDKWGYPIYLQDSNGDYVVKNVEVIPVPYLEKEIKMILECYKNTVQKEG
jgi:hypothetical protein